MTAVSSNYVTATCSNIILYYYATMIFGVPCYHLYMYYHFNSYTIHMKLLYTNIYYDYAKPLHISNTIIIALILLYCT